MVTIWAHVALGALANAQSFPLSFRLVNAAVAYASYLEKAFWPSGLAIFYPLRTNLAADEVALAAAVPLAYPRGLFGLPGAGRIWR